MSLMAKERFSFASEREPNNLRAMNACSKRLVVNVANVAV
jgi:hypothetical protein